MDRYINKDLPLGPTGVNAEDFFVPSPKLLKKAAKNPGQFRWPTGPMTVVEDKDSIDNRWRYRAVGNAAGEGRLASRYPFDSQVRTALQANPDAIVSEYKKSVYINGSKIVLGD